MPLTFCLSLKILVKKATVTRECSSMHCDNKTNKYVNLDLVIRSYFTFSSYALHFCKFSSLLQYNIKLLLENTRNSL